MGTENYSKKVEYILIGGIFTLFVLVTCYKLTNSPLWYDEAIEYWYSKVMVGKLPFVGRLGEYKYYDMDGVIDAALKLCEVELSDK